MSERTVKTSAAEMIGGMTPQMGADRYVFASIADPARAKRLAPLALATIEEDEGLSLLLSTAVARAEGLPTTPEMARITLHVYSDLMGVGLTAAVSTALAAHGIPCNMVAGYHHDHVFVPAERGEEALRVLKGLEEGA